MKILIAVTSHLSYKLVEGQIRFLSGEGHDVYFVSSNSILTKERVEKENGIFYPVDMEREISPVKDVLSLIKIIRLLIIIKPDLINVSTPKASLLFSIASVFLFPLKMKKIFTLRGLRSDTLIGIKKKIIKFTEIFSCFVADKVIVISPSLRDHAVKLNIVKASKSIVLGKGSSNGVNIKKFTKSVESEQFRVKFRKENNILSDAIVFGYVGRLVEDKGINELHKAFINLKDKISKIHLILVGSYDEADCISNELLLKIKKDPNITLLSHTESIELIYAVMDIFVLYSYREGFGNVVIEAASMELPVIVSDIPGLRDTVEAKVTGLLVEPKNSSALEKAMAFYCDNKELKQIYGKNGRNRAVEYFSNEFIWSEQLEVYKNLAS